MSLVILLLLYHPILFMFVWSYWQTIFTKTGKVPRDVSPLFCLRVYCRGVCGGGNKAICLDVVTAVLHFSPYAQLVHDQLLWEITDHDSGDSSVVRAPDSWSKGHWFESLLEQRENFLLQGQLSVLTLISVSVPPCVTAVAYKRPRSFCQKCRWQVTAKHAYTLRMWLYMKWHSIWCTQNVPRWQQILVAPAMPAL